MDGQPDPAGPLTSTPLQEPTSLLWALAGAATDSTGEGLALLSPPVCPDRAAGAVLTRVGDVLLPSPDRCEGGI